MNRLFIYFITLMSFAFIITSCDSGSGDSCKTNDDCSNGKICVDKTCKTDETKSSLNFIAINEGDFIDGYRYDEDGTLDGVQMTITASATNFEDGANITLEIEGDSNAKLTQKLKVLDDGTAIVSFSKFSLNNGENKLKLSGKDKYGKLIENSITVKAQELTLSITSPTEGTVLKVTDDQDAQKYYIQKDVKVEVNGLVSEGNLLAKLVLYDGDNAKYSYVAEPKDGVVIFENVDFREGAWKLVASIDTRANTTVSSVPVNVTAESIGDCEISLKPDNGTVINQKYLKDNNIAQDKKIPLKVESNCPANFKVKFIANGTEIYSGVLTLDGNKTVAETSYNFPENADNGGDTLIRVEASENFDDPNASGGFVENSYTVDTIAPNFVEVTEPAENSILNTETDLDGDIVNGIQFWVKGKVEGSTSTLKVYIDDLDDPIGGVQVYDDAIAQDGSFDTSTLDNNQYTTISVDGERTIIFKAVDEYGNEATFNRKVVVMLSNPNELSLSFNDSKYLNPKNNTNINNSNIAIRLSQYLEGVLSLDIQLNGAPFEYSNTIDVNDSNAPLVKSFSLSNLNDGRYIITPKFKDTNDFHYSGVNGYLNVKTSVPSFSNLKIVQDNDNNNILNMLKDANSTLDGFQTDITMDVSDLYLDNTDCEAEADRVTATLYKINENGDVLSTSDKINCDGKVKFTNVTLPEGNYKLFVKVTDNFGNIGTFESNDLTVDITPPDSDSLFLTVTTNSNEKPVMSDSLFLAADDADNTTPGLQSNFKAYSNDASSIQIKFDTLDKTEDIGNGVADFGELTLKNGSTNITLIATDSVGNITNKLITNVEVDTLVPSLELSISKTTIDDSDDEDNTVAGIQFTVTVENMQNIEDNQIIYIQKGVDDGSGNITWNNVAQVAKDSASSKNIVVTLPLGTYKLRAKAADVNFQEGVSNEVEVNVSSSNCAIISVKKGNTELVSGTNFFNASDIVNGRVSLIVTYTASCNVLGGTTITAKKDGLDAGSVNIDSNLSSTLEIPFSDGENVSLLFEINSNPTASSSFNIKVDTTAPTVAKVVPVLSTITYVNANNPLIGTVGNDDKIGDLNSSLQGAQISITVNVKDAKNGSIEMLVNDGTSDTLITAQNNIASNDENIVLSGTIADNKTHDIKFKVTDEAGNVSITSLYTAVVDVTNPGNLATLNYDGMSATERRTAELNLTWDQSSTDDVSKYVIKYSTNLFDDTNFETLDGTNNKEVVIDNPDLSTANYQKMLTSLTFHKTYTIGVRAYDEVGNASNILIKSTGTDLNLLNGASNIQLTDSGDYTSDITNFKNVGDINDDGYDDFVVAQEFLNNFKGRITIYYGQADPSNIGATGTFQVIDGAADYEQFGSSIASGDFNGDGKTDLIIGVSYDKWYGCSEAWGCYEGSLKIYYNQGAGAQIDTSDMIVVSDSYLSNESSLTDEGSWKAGRLGDTVSFVGDIDGDGYGDIIIGETYSVYNGNKGRAFILKGRADKNDIDLANDANTIILQHNLGLTTGFATSLAGVGNLDNQNYIDVAVGDPINKKVFIYYLNSSSNGTIDNTSSDVVVLAQTNNSFGTEILNNTDINGDGIDDLVVGSGGAQNVKIFLGGAKFTSSQTPNITITTGGTSNFGYYLDKGDFNGDGLDDLIISGTDSTKVFLSKSNNSGAISNADVELTRVGDALGTQESILHPIAFSVNDDNNDTKFDKNDIEDFVIINNKDRAFFIKY